MAIQLATGIATGLASLPQARTIASGSDGPSARYTRDLSGLRTAAQRGVEIAAVDAGKAGIAAALTDLATAETGVVKIEAALAQIKKVTEQASQKTVDDATGIEESHSDILLAQGLSTTDRALLQQEINDLRTEIGNIVTATVNEAGVALLDGDGGSSRTLTYTVGGSDEGGETLTISINAATVSELASGLESAAVTTASGATSADSLAATAQEAAAGIRHALAAARNSASGTDGLRNAYVGHVGAEKASNLELKGEVDVTRAAVRATLEDAGISTFTQKYQRTLDLVDGGGRVSGGGGRASDSGTSGTSSGASGTSSSSSSSSSGGGSNSSSSSDGGGVAISA